MTKHFGAVCAKHPELNGERELKGKGCVGCRGDRDRKSKRRTRALTPPKMRTPPRTVEEKLESNRKRHREQRQGLKADVMAKYGGGKCHHCGEDDLVVLTIDHPDQNGSAHRKEISGSARSMSGWRFYRWLEKEGYPPGYRVLCFNCNIRAWYNRNQ